MNKLCRKNFIRFIRLTLLCLLSAQFSIDPLAQQATPQPTRTEIKIDPKTFDAYVGQYEDAANLGGTIFSFFREGEKFYGQIPGQEKFEVFPTAENKFFLKITAADAEFVRDSNGRVTGMLWRQGGREYNAKRIADSTLR